MYFGITAPENDGGGGVETGKAPGTRHGEEGDSMGLGGLGGSAKLKGQPKPIQRGGFMAGKGLFAGFLVTCPLLCPLL